VAGDGCFDSVGKRALVQLVVSFHLFVSGEPDMLKKLWMDESGVVLSTELILIMVILVIGLVTGLTALKTAVLIRLGDLAGAIGSIDVTYGFSGSGYVSGAANLTSDAYTNGSEYLGGLNAGSTTDTFGLDVLIVNANTSAGGADQIIAGTGTAP
jgi:hypothetical protein